MSNKDTVDDDDYKFLRLVDAMTLINQKVNLIGVVTEIGLSKQSRGTDCCCSIRIVDESNLTSGMSINFFAETFERLPRVQSAGDILQLGRVVVKSHESGVNFVYNKKFSSFALYQGKEGSNFVPYQASSKFAAGYQDPKFIAELRKLTVDHKPVAASCDTLSLKDIKQGDQFNLICKVLHICEVKSGEWMLFVWDGTDAPPLNIHTKLRLDEEHENPLPLQLEAIPLPRNVLCKFPTVGTVLRMTNDKCSERMDLHLLKAGKWVMFRNIGFEVRFGLWCGILLSRSKFSFLPDEDDYALECQRTNKERYKSKWDRKPYTCFPAPFNLTNTDHQRVPFVTLMDVLTYSKVVAKFRCVVRVVTTLPGHPRDFKDPSGTYRLRFTLEDPTARIHAYLYAEDGETFFGGHRSIEKMINMHNTLLGVDKTNDADLNEKPRNPPWVECCLKSYNINKIDVWGSIRYQIFATRLVNCS